MALEGKQPDVRHTVTTRAGRISRGRKFLFAMLVMIGFFIALEAVLTALGIRPLRYDSDPFVGFASSIPLFIEEPDSSGHPIRTTAENRLAFFNRQNFPATKAKGTFRIFCLGGSTTYGRPYNDTTSFAGWLRVLLPAADPSRRWEVVNAGGISYASYRVALLMDELVEYEPDLFIVYCGHNEFLESRTYGNLQDTPTFVRDLHGRLSSTRTFSVLARLVGSGRKSPPAAADASDLLPAEVDAMLDRSIGPADYHRDHDWQRNVIAHYRFSLERMIAIAHAAGAKILFVMPASNLRDFEPFKSEPREDLESQDADLCRAYLHRASEDFQAARFADALEALDQAIAIDDCQARLHFLRGRVLLRLERDADAKQAFRRARDEDVCPLRALTKMHEVVLDVARRHRVPCVDFAAIVEQQAAQGIPGNDWFLDHVHPTIEGHRQLALQLMDELDAAGDVTTASDWGEPAIDRVTQQVLGQLDTRANANALRNLAKVLRWAGKFDEAARLSIQAVKGLPGDAEAHAMAGDAWVRLGNLNAARAEYVQAVSVNPDDKHVLLSLGQVLLQLGDPAAARNYLERAVQIGTGDAQAKLELGNALFQLGDWDAAVAAYQGVLTSEPQRVDVLKSLARTLQQAGRPSAARRYYERALDVDPLDAAAHNELGWLLLDSGELQAAEDAFLLALLLDPGLGRANEGLALLARRRESAAADKETTNDE